MIGILKFLLGLGKSYRVWLIGAGIASAIASVLVFYGNARENEAKIAAAKRHISELQIDITAARDELAIRNERIRRMNERQRQRIREAEQAVAIAQAQAAELREARDELNLQMEEGRFGILEAIRDDEEMADWADGITPSIAWGMLQQATQGTPSNDMRADH